MSIIKLFKYSMRYPGLNQAMYGHSHVKKQNNKQTKENILEL